MRSGPVAPGERREAAREAGRGWAWGDEEREGRKGRGLKVGT